MSSTLTGVLVFACTLTAALLGMRVRRALPPSHMDSDSKDVVKLVMGLVATMCALVLGLLISSAHTAHDAQEAEVQQLGVHVFQIDHILGLYGESAVEARALLRSLIADDIARTWPTSGARPTAAKVLAEAEQLFARVAGLTPHSDIERIGQSRALTLLSSIGETRRLMSVQAKAPISWFLLGVLVSWLTLLFFGFGLFARFNFTVVMALVAGATAVATACLLILDMNEPYRGWMQISNAPLIEVIQQPTSNP